MYFFIKAYKRSLILCYFFYSTTSFSQSIKDSLGFEFIFDGKSLKNWEGDSQYWRVENGCMVGEVTAQNLLSQNSFIIWNGGTTKDFELKVEYRVSDKGNSGINYRSERVTGNPWALKGYQSDIDGENQWSGQNYEERGRTFLAMRGEAVQAYEDKKLQIFGSVGNRKELETFIHNGWNECHLIVRGNTMIHLINGHIMSIVIDQDLKNRKFEGLLGVQVHVGPPMTIEYKNFRLKKL